MSTDLMMASIWNMEGFNEIKNHLFLLKIMVGGRLLTSSTQRKDVRAL